MVVWLRKIEWRIKDALQSLRGRIGRSLFDALKGLASIQYRILAMISSIPFWDTNKAKCHYILLS